MTDALIAALADEQKEAGVDLAKCFHERLSDPALNKGDE